jgi:hypothetical protein
MVISRFILLVNVLVVGCLWAALEYRVSVRAKNQQSQGPDVIVGDIPAIARYGSSATETAFAIGTTSCNIGNAQLAWISNSNRKPVITQNMYRVKDGRIEQIGMSWLKHGWFALQQSLCGSCIPSGTGSWLGVGCSDPYSAGNNANQSDLGPRSEVNATTGVFSWPKRNLPSTGPLDGRLRVRTNDINPNLNQGARYFVESQYVHPDDASAGNALNNASYREVFVSPISGGWTMSTSGSAPTVRMQPAIYAWQRVHPDVELYTVDVPGDGRIIVGVRTTTLPGGAGYHTEFAVENLNSHQSVRSFGVKYGSSVIANPGFSDVDYQFEPYSGADWTPLIVGEHIEWATQTFAANQNANALRWNTLYSFRCDSELPPRKITLGMFRPGVVQEMSIDLIETVAPESHRLTGQVAEGSFEDIFESDGNLFKLSPSTRLKKPTVELLLETTSLTNQPTDMAFRLNSCLSEGKFEDINQVISLMNQNRGDWEAIDIRPAARSPETIEITPTGDFRRFVHAKTGEVKAKIEWIDPNQRPRHPFVWTIDIDQAVWLIGN